MKDRPPFPRCLLLTLGVSAPAKSGLFSGKTDEQFSAWVRQFPEFSLLAEVVPKVIAPQHQTPGPDAWERVAQVVRLLRPSIDGVVILHDRDLIVPAAVELDLLLHGFDLPVMITSAGDRRSSENWRTNIVIALQAIASAVAGVSVLDGNRIVRASDARTERGVLIGPNTAKFDFGLRRVTGSTRPSWPRPQIVLERSMRIWRYVPGLALPETLQSHAILLQAPAMNPRSWTELEHWSASLGSRTHIICQTPQTPPKKILSRWGWVSDPDDAVAINQALWAFGQGSRWREAASFARQRRNV